MMNAHVLAGIRKLRHQKVGLGSKAIGREVDLDAAIQKIE